MKKPHLVMVGNGIAGVRTIEQWLKAAPDRYRITIIGADAHPNSNRILLSPVLGGEMDFDDIADTGRMIEAAAAHRLAVVIGGGPPGLEAANGLRARRMDVTVVQVCTWLLERQLDEVAGRMLQGALEQRGLKFPLEKHTGALLADESGRVAAGRFRDGMQIPAELVVMAAGIRSNGWIQVSRQRPTARTGAVRAPGASRRGASELAKTLGKLSSARLCSDTGSVAVVCGTPFTPGALDVETLSIRPSFARDRRSGTGTRHRRHLRAVAQAGRAPRQADRRRRLAP